MSRAMKNARLSFLTLLVLHQETPITGLQVSVETHVSVIRLCICRMEGFVMHSTRFVWTLKEKAWSCENAMTGKHRSGDLLPTPRKK